MLIYARANSNTASIEKAPILALLALFSAKTLGEISCTMDSNASSPF